MIKLRYLLPLLLLAVFSFAQDGPRYALVVGNSSYEGMADLENPVNDAQDIQAALKRLGFTVSTITDADLSTMEDAVLAFGRQLEGDSRALGLFYYAGHAVQSDGSNYLIPSDTEISNEAFLKTKAISSQAILEVMQRARNAVNLVFLDACRDNPFGWARSASRGLTAVANQPPGSIVVYATSAGSVAQDGDGRNGVFTSALLQNLELPGLDLNQVLDRTAASVQRKTDGAQIPAIYKQYFDEIVLKPGTNTAAANSTSPQFGSVTVATGDLLITLDTAAKVSLLGQTVDIPAGGRLPIKDVAEGPVDIEVAYADGHRESRNVYVEQGRETAVRFDYKVGIQPPTDVYVYGLMDTSLWLDEQYTMFLDEASGENNYIIRNPLDLGKHAIWWLNHTTMYAYVFELKSGVNRISPSFESYDLPDFDHRFEFLDNEGPETAEEEFEFALFDKDWNKTDHTAKISVTMSRIKSPDADLRKETGSIRFVGEIRVEHPGGLEVVPIDQSRELSTNYFRSRYTDIYRDENYKIQYKLYLNQDFLTIQVSTFHLRPSER
jgi:hypothetical protein